MKKSLTFSFAMLLGVVVLLSPVSNALEADMSSSITYRPEDTQICYVSEIDEVISNTEIDKSVRQTVKERARTGATFYSITPESQEQVERLFGVHFVENALLDTMEHSIAPKDQLNVFFNSSTKVTETEYTRYWLDGNVSISLCAMECAVLGKRIRKRSLNRITVFPKSFTHRSQENALRSTQYRIVLAVQLHSIPCSNTMQQTMPFMSAMKMLKKVRRLVFQTIIC